MKKKIFLPTQQILGELPLLLRQDSLEFTLQTDRCDAIFVIEDLKSVQIETCIVELINNKHYID